MSTACAVTFARFCRIQARFRRCSLGVVASDRGRQPGRSLGPRCYAPAGPYLRGMACLNLQIRRFGILTPADTCKGFRVHTFCTLLCLSYCARLGRSGANMSDEKSCEVWGSELPPLRWRHDAAVGSQGKRGVRSVMQNFGHRQSRRQVQCPLGWRASEGFASSCVLQRAALSAR